MPKVVREEDRIVDPDKGIIRIDAFDKSYPTNPKDVNGIVTWPACKDLGGRQFVIQAGAQDVRFEFTLESLFRKTVDLQIQIQTTQAQSVPLVLRLFRKAKREGAALLLLTQEIPLPNTQGQWMYTDPIRLGVEVGGNYPPTVFSFTHAQVESGANYFIKSFQLTPIQDFQPYSDQWFGQWFTKLQKKQNWIPDIQTVFDPTQVQNFLQLCQDLQPLEIQVGRARHKSKWDIVNDNKDKLAELSNQCDQAAIPLLEKLEQDEILLHLWNNLEFLQYIVLLTNHSTLADFCQENPGQAEIVMDFLESMDLLHEFFMYGGGNGGTGGNLNAAGPIQNQYGRALQIYTELMSRDEVIESPVLKKLALAVALELAVPIQVFDNPNEQIDALERYHHYEQAYLQGELDNERFEQFSVWELRMVINSNASHWQLSWCREMMKNYHPEQILMEDESWRYCMVVKTDVKYKKPEWLPNVPKDYVQLLSGGGQCGPRAWMGRFVLQAFGIPIWGCQQPGHAALCRWTPTGWVTRLGAAFQFSFWLPKNNFDKDPTEIPSYPRYGKDFEYESLARQKVGNELYAIQVTMLQFLSLVAQESDEHMYQKQYCTVDVNHLWGSLSVLQRKYLAISDDDNDTCTETEAATCEIPSQMALLQSEDAVADTTDDHYLLNGPTISEDGKIVSIPMSSCNKVTRKGAQVVKSFLGGSQLHAPRSFQLEYQLSPEIMMGSGTKFYLSMKVCTVSSRELTPVMVSLQSFLGGESQSSSFLREYTLNIPYTKGYWQETDPIEIEFPTKTTSLDLSMMTLKLVRQNPCGGLTMKDLYLRKMDGSFPTWYDPIVAREEGAATIKKYAKWDVNPTDQSIHVPVSIFLNGTPSEFRNIGVMTFDSVLGGHLFYGPAGFSKYVLKVEASSLGIATNTKYLLYCKILTVHDDSTPIVVKFKNDQNKPAQAEIAIFNTNGAWQLTQPIEVSFLTTESRFLFTRAESHGILIRDFKFVPLA